LNYFNKQYTWGFEDHYMLEIDPNQRVLYRRNLKINPTVLNSR